MLKTIEEERLINCRKCPLSESRTKVVPGKGKLDSDIILVGEAPGREEDIQGIPFVGRAGKLLDRILEVAGLNRDSLYVTNACKCRPPYNRPPMNTEIDACFEYLRDEILSINPSVIVTLGKTALSAFFKDVSALSPEIGRIRTFQIEGKRFYLIPAFHPSYFLRQQRNTTDKYRMVGALKSAVLAARAVRELDINDFGTIVDIRHPARVVSSNSTEQITKLPNTRR